jgi:eukaryotic-like serine/threonine-protein kinase
MSQAYLPGDPDMTNVSPPNGASDGGLDLDLSGRQLGDYRLLRRLGRGAMADVYLAEQGSLRRQVAFKALKRELAADSTYVRRFHNEAQAAAALVQANIVQIYEVGCIEGWHYIAQEYVEGQNLSQFITRNGTPDVKLALTVMRQVAAALCKSAERGIVHRNIKPENIMLGRSGEVKVADFGLARVGVGEDVVKLTQVGITMGTPLYMSPEQVEGRPLDPRSDIYSLGVTCFHMLAGRPPFRGDTALSVALQHVRKQPERLENLRPDLPAAVCRIVHKMLAKDSGERFQSPRELLKELRALQIEGVDLQWPAEMDEFNSVETAALGNSRWAATQRLQTLMDESTARLNSRRWIAVLASAIIASLLVGAGVAWGMRDRFLLDLPRSTLGDIPKMDSAERQLQYAVWLPPNEPAWKEAALLSVEQYFPADKKSIMYAKQGLAKLYLANLGETDRAIPLFVELATWTDMDPDFEKSARVFGLVGESFAYLREKGNAEKREENGKKSVQLLSEVAEICGGLDPAKVNLYLQDYQMRGLVAWVIVHTDNSNKEQWKDLLQQSTLEDPASG